MRDRRRIPSRAAFKLRLASIEVVNAEHGVFFGVWRWRDRQIVPATWVAESTRSYSDTPTGGYGYMWWTSVSPDDVRGPNVRLLRPTFWADGFGGQYAVVVPSLDLVVVNVVDAELTAKHMGQLKMERLVWLVESAERAPDIGP